MTECRANIRANIITTSLAAVFNLLVVLYISFGVMPGVRRAQDESLRNRADILENRRTLQAIEQRLIEALRKDK